MHRAVHARTLTLALATLALSACGSSSDPEGNPGSAGAAGSSGGAGGGTGGSASGGTAGSASGGAAGGGAVGGGAGQTSNQCPEASAAPTLFDSFESGDMSASNADGFSWGSNNRTSVVTSTEVVWNNGAKSTPIGSGQDWTPFSGEHSLRFRYPAMEPWSEQRFKLGAAYPEIWFRYWLRVPKNFVHEPVSESSHNNKFFALWMDGYSQKGDGPTIVWNFWGDDSGGSRFTYSLSQEANGTNGHHGSYDNFIRVPEDRGRWMQVVLYAKMSSSATSNDGESRIWRRWQDECDFTLISETVDRGLVAPAAGPNGWAAGYIMGWSNSWYAEDTEWLLDDFTVSSSSLLPD
jgi:hypothetical protein